MSQPQKAESSAAEAGELVCRIHVGRAHGRWVAAATVGTAYFHGSAASRSGAALALGRALPDNERLGRDAAALPDASFPDAPTREVHTVDVRRWRISGTYTATSTNGPGVNGIHASLPDICVRLAGMYAAADAVPVPQRAHKADPVARTTPGRIYTPAGAIGVPLA